jgi:hypothetical protein
MDLYDKWRKECKVTVEIVKASKLHRDALKKRIAVAEGGLNDWISEEKGSLTDCLNKTIKDYEKNPEKFDKYITTYPTRNKIKPKKSLKNLTLKLKQ